jgi:cell division protein FtsN
MSRVDAAAAMDRLPWLPDEPQPPRCVARGRALMGWSGAAIAAASAVGLWVGVMSTDEASPPTATVRLPEARPVAPAKARMPIEPEVNLPPAPQVRSAPARDVPIAAPPAPKAEPAKADKPSVTQAPPTARAVPGTAGRAVQAGAFGSPQQAMNGWRYVVRAYPGLAGLDAMVTTSRNSKGRLFYRFQVGTTSQAHSEVLCQRMQKIRFSCAVVGLPRSAKVER